MQLCGLPVKELTDNNRNKLLRNAIALGAMMHLLGIEFQVLQDVLTEQFGRKGQGVVDENVCVARAGYEYAAANFKPRGKKLEDEDHDTSDWKAACEKALEWGDTIYTGLFLQREQPTLSDLDPVLKEGGPLARRPLGLSTEDSARIIKRMC